MSNINAGCDVWSHLYDIFHNLYVQRVEEDTELIHRRWRDVLELQLQRVALQSHNKEDAWPPQWELETLEKTDKLLPCKARSLSDVNGHQQYWHFLQINLFSQSTAALPAILDKCTGVFNVGKAEGFTTKVVAGGVWNQKLMIEVLPMSDWRPGFRSILVGWDPCFPKVLPGQVNWDFHILSFESFMSCIFWVFGPTHLSELSLIHCWHAGLRH